MARLEQSLTDFFDSKEVKENNEYLEIESKKAICSKSSTGRLSQGEANARQPAKVKSNENRMAKSKIAAQKRLPINKSSRTLVTHSKTDNTSQQHVMKKPNAINVEQVQSKSNHSSLPGSVKKRAQNSESVCPMPDAILTVSPRYNNGEPSPPSHLSPHDAEYYSDDFTSTSVTSEYTKHGTNVRQCQDFSADDHTTPEQQQDTPEKSSSQNVQSKTSIKSARPETPYVLRQLHDLRNRKMSDHKVRLQTDSYPAVIEGAVDVLHDYSGDMYSSTAVSSTVPSLPSIHPTSTYDIQMKKNLKEQVILPEIDGLPLGPSKAAASRAKILPSTAVLQSGRLDMTITMPIATQRKGDKHRTHTGFPNQMTVTFVNRVIPFQAIAPTHHGINRVSTPNNRSRRQRYGQSSNRPTGKKKMTLLAATIAASKVRARERGEITDDGTTNHNTWLPHPDSDVDRDVVKNRSFWPPFDTSQSIECRQRYLNNFLDM